MKNEQNFMQLVWLLLLFFLMLNSSLYFHYALLYYLTLWTCIQRKVKQWFFHVLSTITLTHPDIKTIRIFFTFKCSLWYTQNHCRAYMLIAPYKTIDYLMYSLDMMYNYKNSTEKTAQKGRYSDIREPKTGADGKYSFNVTHLPIYTFSFLDII